MTRKCLHTTWIALLAVGGILAVSHSRAAEEQTEPGAPRSPYARAEIVLPLAVAGKDAGGAGGVAPGGTQEQLPLPSQRANAAPSMPLNLEPAPAGERGFISADYLLWWIKKGPTPVLLTKGTAASQGVLGQDGTTILIGSDVLNYGTGSGGRFGAGYNFGDGQMWGVEFSGFFLSTKSIDLTVSYDGDPLGDVVLARPFLSVFSNDESALALASPGDLAGTFKVHSHSHFWGFDANVVAHSIREADRRFDFLAGFRCMALDETLRMSEDINVLADGAIIFQTAPVGQLASQLQPPAGSRITTLDDFATRNRFYGGQLGGRFQWLMQRWTVDLTGKVAFGFTHQLADIFGQSTLFDANNAVVATTPGGVLAIAAPNPSPKANIGNYTRDQFAVVPEVVMQVHYDLTSRIRATLGYNGVYWSAVARPGDQIDRNLNPKLVPTGQGFGDPFDPTTEQTRPQFRFRDNGLWAHGINVGLEFRY